MSGRVHRPVLGRGEATASSSARLPPGSLATFRDGRPGRISAEAARLPDSARFDAAGECNAESLDLFRLVVGPLMHRLVPWARVVVGPALEVNGSNVGEGWRRLGGCCMADGRLLLLSADSSPSFFLETAMHEALHAAWWRMGKVERGEVEHLLTTGHWMPGAYLDGVEERAARAFAAYATGRYHGLPATPHASTAHGFFERLWSGALADAELAASENRGRWGEPRYPSVAWRLANVAASLVGVQLKTGGLTCGTSWLQSFRR